MLKRQLILSFGALAALAAGAGCGGGGGGGGAPPPPPATPTPFGVTSHSFANGSSYTASGNSLASFAFSGDSPSPSSSIAATVAQAVSVTTGATFNGQSNLANVKTVETDTTALQQVVVNTNAYYANVPTASGNDLMSYGYTSSDTFGEQLTVLLGTGNGLVDMLPEISGAACDPITPNTPQPTG